MNPTRILVSQTTEDILAESIAMNICRRDNVSLFAEAVVPISQLAELLRSSNEEPDVVILIGKNCELQGYVSELLEQRPQLVVVRIAIGSNEVQMDLRQLGLSELIASVCELSRQRCGKTPRSPNEAKVLVEPITNPNSLDLIDAPSSGVALRDALRWLDSVLLWYLNQTSDSANDFPGLTISRSTIEELIRNRTTASTDPHNQTESVGLDFLQTLEGIGTGEDPLADLCRGLQLNWLEIRAFLLCLAPELDNKYQRIFGFLHDDLSRRHVTLGLLAAILNDPPAMRLGSGKIDGLFRWGLIGSHANSRPCADEPLRVDPTLVFWLTGNSDALVHDPRLAGLVREDSWPGADVLDDTLDIPERNRLGESLASGDDAYWLVLAGRDPSGWRALLEQAAQRMGLSLLRINPAGLQTTQATTMDQRLVHLGWTARLTECVPVIDVSEMEPQQFSTGTLKTVIDSVAVPGRFGVLVASDIMQVFDVLPDDGYRLLQWNSAAKSLPVSVFARSAEKAGLRLGHDDYQQLAAAYPLSVGEICRAVKLAVARGAAVETPARQAVVLSEACRQVACPELPRFATALQPSFQLDEVVLPSDRRQQLDDIVSHVLHAGTVLNTWGFGAQLPYGRGVTALFTGPSGTGKTMAAQAIGRALQRTVFAVDLSRVVSKFIGETEKNLDAVFVEAERAGAVLLFDEADALFGKRSEVKDAHDRYANIETAYLLQRMEAFSGLAILTSNFGQNLDSAFLRRLRFAVEFPRPDAAAREIIWRQCLPQEAPLAEDLDLSFLARRVEITGGNIRQITLRAAFSAAAEGVPINLDHILKATRAEVLKLGMPGLVRELSDQAA